MNMGEKVQTPIGVGELVTDKFHLENEDWYMVQVGKGSAQHTHTVRADEVRPYEKSAESDNSKSE